MEGGILGGRQTMLPSWEVSQSGMNSVINDVLKKVIGWKKSYGKKNGVVYMGLRVRKTLTCAGRAGH